MAAPRVFVNYCHEEPEHHSWVLELAASLRRNGVDASLDTWVLTAGQDVAFFMESQIRDSDFVVLVCTPKYAQKSNFPSGGVGYEKNIISAEMLQARDSRPKFLPILHNGEYSVSIPTYLGTKHAIDFKPACDQDSALRELLRAIFGHSHPSKPPLGPNPFERSHATAGQGPQAGETGALRPGAALEEISIWEGEARSLLRGIAQENGVVGICAATDDIVRRRSTP